MRLPTMFATRTPIGLLLGLAVTAACPAEIVTPTRAVKPGPPVVDESDPRVVRDGEDLYPVAAIERVAKREPAAAPLADGLGTGKPDETNGVCRLFAPMLTNPECCKGEYGIDAERVRELCGLELYLGESFQGTCGYYFHKTGDKPLWMRASFVEGPTVADAAATHDAKMKRVAKDDSFASSPVPGVQGALWSRSEKLRWAFVPGWDKVRMLSWSSDTCGDDAMGKVIEGLTRAKQPPKDAPRAGLIPRAGS